MKKKDKEENKIKLQTFHSLAILELDDFSLRAFYPSDNKHPTIVEMISIVQITYLCEMFATEISYFYSATSEKPNVLGVREGESGKLNEKR